MFKKFEDWFLDNPFIGMAALLGAAVLVIILVFGSVKVKGEEVTCSQGSLIQVQESAKKDPRVTEYRLEGQELKAFAEVLKDVFGDEARLENSTVAVHFFEVKDEHGVTYMVEVDKNKCVTFISPAQTQAINNLIAKISAKL